MFTLVKSILLKPLAYPEPDRLVLVTQNSSNRASMNSLLFNTKPLDPITFIVSPLVLALAGAVPYARQTLRIGPAECLRVE